MIASTFAALLDFKTKVLHLDVPAASSTAADYNQLSSSARTTSLAD